MISADDYQNHMLSRMERLLESQDSERLGECVRVIQSDAKLLSLAKQRFNYDAAVQKVAEYGANKDRRSFDRGDTATMAESTSAANLFRLAGAVGGLFYGSTENFETRKWKDGERVLRKARDLVIDYEQNLVQRIEDGMGVVIMGTYGAGKDHLLSSIAKQVIVAYGTVAYTTGITLTSQLQSAISKNSKKTREEIIQEHVSPTVLWLSDPTVQSIALSAFRQEAYYEILQRRSERDRITFVSLNAPSPEAASALLGGALFSRLCDNALLIDLCVGHDGRQIARRKKRTTEEKAAYIHSLIVAGRFTPKLEHPDDGRSLDSDALMQWRVERAKRRADFWSQPFDQGRWDTRLDWV